MDITIIGVPYNLDQPHVGMGKAPKSLLDAGLQERLEKLGCIITQIVYVAIPDSDHPSEERLGQMLGCLREAVAEACSTASFPLVLGGDCLTALGTLAGLGRSDQTAVVWFDAHGDFNTPETTLSGYPGGMPLACAVGRGLDELRVQVGLKSAVAEHNVALLGVRDLDPPEEQVLAGSSVKLLRTDDLQRDPLVLEHMVRELRTVPQLYLHVDIDVLDPVEAPGVDYPATAGMQLAELQESVRHVAGMPNLAALALTAVNPEKDADGRTVNAALSVIEAAIGQRKSFEQ
jgi:arginase